MTHHSLRSPLIVGLCWVLASSSVTWGPNHQAVAQNSTEKIRVKPNAQAAQAGAAIHWESEFASALEKSKSSGKPIFWYMPTIRGTFMDRQVEIDRYMLAGPFSWPSLIALINDRFIPLRSQPDRARIDRYELEVYKFIEPGFLVVSPDESLQLSADRLTTLHPRWLFRQLAQTVNDDRSWDQLSGNDSASDVEQWWKRAHDGNWRLPPEEIEKLLQSRNVELELLAGMLQFSMGEQSQAKATWQSAAEHYPDHPLGWKAACEGQGFGPFCRGFEVFSSLPENLSTSTEPNRITSRCAEPLYAKEQLWQVCTQFLLRMQDRSGGFFDSDYDFGGTDSLPNVHVAVTSLVGLALLESEKNTTDPQQSAMIRDAVTRAARFVADDSHLNLNDRDEILWAQAYRVRFLAAVKAHQLTDDALNSALQNAVQGLEAIQLANGSWYHEYANSFVSATALSALYFAGEQGAEVNSGKVALGLKRIESQRFRNGAYPYATRSPNSKSEGDEDRTAASGGRISVCELARRQWGQIEEPAFVQAIETSLKYHELLAQALKYDDHTSIYEYGGFFFWYDMQARSEAISLIEDEATRQRLGQEQLKLLLALPEIDGCFVDSHELGRCYGTAMALISLSQVEQ